MKAEFIRIEPFAFKQILSADIKKGMNTHGGGVVCGYIREEDEEQYTLYVIGSTPVILYVIDEDGEEQVFFYGILADLNISRENSQLLMEVTFTSYTRLMDLLPQNRAFQSAACTYNEIISHLCAGYEGSAFIMNPLFSNIPIQELIVQYQETNWEFLLRLASHFNSMVISDFLTPGVKFYFGLPNRQPVGNIIDSEYRLEKSLISYQQKIQNGVIGTSEYDDMLVVWSSRELLEVGDRKLFEDRPYVVYASQSQLNGHQLHHTYILATENGLKIPKLYNKSIIGASIDGIVTGVQGTVVNIRMGIEDVQPSARWYPYATVFSSPDGSGWYCMPQAGDEIRLYFPTRSEKHAYAISSVHKPVASQPRNGNQGSSAEAAPPRTNVLNNELRSQDGKVVQLLEDRIVMSNGKGLTISMVDNQGIGVVSNGDLNLKATGQVFVSGSSLNISGSTEVSIKSGESSITLSGSDAIIKSANVKVQ